MQDSSSKSPGARCTETHGERSHLLATKHSDFRPMERNLGRNEPPVSRSSEGLPCHSSGSEECLSATLHSEQPHHMWGYDEQKQKGCLHMEFRARRLKQHSLLRTTPSVSFYMSPSSSNLY
jgi:hypothetical protein